MIYYLQFSLKEIEPSKKMDWTFWDHEEPLVDVGEVGDLSEKLTGTRLNFFCLKTQG